ncbi:SubName: Full=Uncharacterized protein {ECO:0000313/EMBL:CCA70423.1} [Serendipita indica DSM 11827]|nr:SubName: Full=Uncharacterized protein {ECO:0000313/EMBL:CCA70423.1} [Serendipita indica DSM 11827]
MALRLLVALWLGTTVLAAEGFNPRAYEKKHVECPTVHRKGGLGEPEETTINMSYVDINPTANRTLLMVHGWPGLWSVWSNQIMHFSDKYHLLVPDLRGFGDSIHPGDVQASGTFSDIVGDLICILQDAGVSKAVCIGHDWGSPICHEAARMRPDLFEGVVGASLPYLPAAAPKMLSIEALIAALPKLTYNLYFMSETEKAIAELNKDVRRTIRAALRSLASPSPYRFLRSKTSFLKAYNHLEEIPPVPFFTPDQEDYYVEQYQKQGFDHTLQFYTHENKYKNWEFAHNQGNFTIPLPVLAVYPINDPVADWPLVALVAGSHTYLPYLTKRVLQTAHWPHLEKPKEFNAILEEWLDDLDVKLLEARIGELKREMRALSKELSAAKKKKKRRGEL